MFVVTLSRGEKIIKRPRGTSCRKKVQLAFRREREKQQKY